ncbi:DNA polymerase III subunit beta [Clostridium vitabionis]|uniref:DNA polymerase III subunit beta n=1 Tax=Clostridium vitabionis TaxID=2784388 RepID=UPI00188D1D8D|nr:DNA polymerase III subunit beta [Clostridium vitabionis]
MKLIFKQENLLAAINTVAKAVPVRTTMSILQCILIDASGSDIHLTGNNTDLGIETVADGEIVEHGRICLEAKLFSEIIRKLSGGEDIVITSDEKLVTVIQSGPSKFRIQGRDAEEYTYVPHIERDLYVAISEFRLKEIIRQTIFALSPNDSNPLMTGEYLTVHENQLMLCALDGHRIALRKVALRDSYKDISAILPGKSLQEISRILGDDAESEVLIFFDENHAMFEFNRTVVVTRLIDGEYFNVAQMLPHDYQTRVKVNRQMFLNEIDKATILIHESDKKPVVFKISDGEMQIRLNSTYGQMNTEIGIEKNGDDLTIGFNPTFFIDALRNIDDEEVTIYLLNSKSPCFLRDDADSYIYLILPVNFGPEDY